MANFKKAATWLTVCATFVGGFEGLALKAYPDRLAHNLPTVCYGETEGVKLGDRYTKEQCTDMLANKLPRYWNEIAPSIKVKVSDNEKIAYTSFAYNVGSGAFRKSAMVRRLNAGDHKGACDALLAYDHASGKKVRGLTRRREAERRICLTPSSSSPDVRDVAAVSKPPVPVKIAAPVCSGVWVFKRCH
jgi:lysozyme